ncbi:MAG: lantibiotic dehydratase family protein [Bacteroidota bacterium]
MKTQSPYKSLDSYVVRTPVLSIAELSGITEEHIQKLCKTPFISEAIYTASPDLHSKMTRYLKGDDDVQDDKLVYTLLKYIVRMSSRCTPFGLFSGCALGEFAEVTKVELNNLEFHKRFSRLDMNYLGALTQNIEADPVVREQLLYYKNSSLYLLRDQLRYIEFRYFNAARKHYTVSIDHSHYTEAVLNRCSNGATIRELAALIPAMDPEISMEDATWFVNELIDNQILVSSISPSITGKDYFEILRDEVSNDTYSKSLNTVSDILNKINQDEIGKGFSYYKQLTETLENFGVAFDLKFLLQTDLSISYQANQLSNHVREKVDKALIFLNKLNSVVDNEQLNKFRDAFYNKYEDEEIPLSLALDVESGVGFPVDSQKSFDISPLVDDLNMSGRNFNDDSGHNKIKWIKRDDLLNLKLLEAIKSDHTEIILTDEDVDHFVENWNDLPNTFSVGIEVIGKNELGEEVVAVQDAGGATASYLLSRFCHADQDIHGLVNQIIEKDERDKDRCIYAEIVHLPEKRAGNILQRPALRQYEIPYLAKSNLGEKHQISIDDITISVVNRKVVLRSVRHNKEIKPMLASAHNYIDKSLPIYHFLCELQYQNVKNSISFTWGNLFQFHDFFPRVVYDGVVLSPAMWLVTDLTLKEVAESDKALREWLSTRKIPEKVFLKEFDNKLLIDFSNPLSVEMFLTTVKNKSQVTLTEYLYDMEQAIVTHQGKPYTNEVIMSYYKESND